MSWLNKFLYTGCRPNMPVARARNVRFFNLSLLVFFVTVVFFIFFNSLFTKILQLAYIEGTLAIVLATIYLIHRAGHWRTATVGFFIIMHLFIVSVSMYFSVGKMAEYIHFVMIMVLMLMYGQRLFFYPLYLLNIFLFYAPQLFLNAYPKAHYSWTNPLILFVSLFILIKIFNKEQSAYERVLEKRNDQLKKLNREKSQMLSIAAHDLKSPLTRISGLLSIIKMSSSNLTPEQLEMIEKVNKVSKDQNDMIKQVLDMTYLESVSENLTLERLDICRVLENVISDFEAAALQKRIHLATEFESHALLCMANPNALSHVLENLMSNAIKFSPTDSNITLKAIRDNQWIKVSIKDEGPGFAHGELDKVFKPFQKLSARPTGNESSSGLGLSIAKRYMDAMGGSISLVSQHGKGSTFTIRLPKI